MKDTCNRYQQKMELSLESIFFNKFFRSQVIIQSFELSNAIS